MNYEYEHDQSVESNSSATQKPNSTPNANAALQPPGSFVICWSSISRGRRRRTPGHARPAYTGQNPATGVKRHPTFSRERVMNSLEVGVLVQALLLLPERFAAAVTVLLTTGARANEVMRMRWSEINLQTGSWVQAYTKNKKRHTTYLPTQARAALLTLPQQCDWVFQGREGSPWTVSGLEKAWWIVREALKLDDVRLHDFRRTLSTHLYRATKDEYLVKRCINHVNRSVTAIYVRISEEEVARALQAQADRFFALTPPRLEAAGLEQAPPPNLVESLGDGDPQVDRLNPSIEAQQVPDCPVRHASSHGPWSDHTARGMDGMSRTAQADRLSSLVSRGRIDKLSSRSSGVSPDQSKNHRRIIAHVAAIGASKARALPMTVSLYS
jgi:Phage integrase family